jgi:signal transduction histidine kinase
MANSQEKGVVGSTTNGRTRAKALMQEMKSNAQELAEELGLPPEAKYDLLSAMYSSETFSGKDDLEVENYLLREQLARKEQLAAVIAHDLRGPLGTILNYAQRLGRQTYSSTDSEATIDKKNAAIQHQTSIIVGLVHRMNRQVNDLLDVSHLSSNQFSLIRERCDIVALANEMLEQIRPLAPYHAFTLKTPNRPLIGNWDAGRLQQALGNLLDNAIKYSGEETTITVTVGEVNDHARVSVNNQGTSIPSNDIGQLFRPYTRLTTSQRQHGSGLGLFICKSIIEAHGGSLRLEPKNEETAAEHMKGTTFTFELPLANETQMLS